MSPSYTRSYPLVAARGEGAMVEDVDGNRFLDFAAGIAVVATGHCHPKVVEAIQQQAARLIHMSGTDFYYENMVQLAEKLAALAPGGVPKRVYFGNSGTEAIEAAIKLARYHTGRGQFVAFFGAFHGRTMGSLALTGSKSVQKKGFFPDDAGRPSRALRLLLPLRLRQDARFLRGRMRRRSSKTSFSATTLPPEDVAAIFVEPVQGEGGYIVPPKKFFDELRRVADKYGILMIFDEVQSGMGRTGKMFACEHFDAVPDIMTLAKGIASGMPLGATIARAELMNWPPGAHASTFGGNPVCVAAALATIELLEQELIDNAARVGAHMKARLRRISQALPDRRRCARPGTDDRDRAGARSGDQGARPGAARPPGTNVLRARPAGAGRGPEFHPAVPAAGDHQGSGRFRRGHDRGVPAGSITYNRGFACEHSMSAAGSIKKPDPSASIAIRPAAPTCCAIWIASPTRFATGPSTQLQAIHVIEHVSDVIRSMEEFHRLVRTGGEVLIVTPHYTDFSSFCDPTHRWHLNSFSLRYFGENHGGFGYYSKARFEEISVRLKLLAFWRWLGFEWLVNTFPRYRRFWEHYLCYVVRGKVIEWRLRAVK